MYAERYCRHCGAELSPGAAFCQSCGATTAYSPPAVVPGVAGMLPEKLLRPTGVTILAILGFIGGLCEMVIGVGLLVVGAFVLGMGEAALDAIFAAAASIVAVVLIIFGLIDLVISWGLWGGKNWARIVFIIVEVLGILGSVVALFTTPIVGIIGLIVGGIIIYYLLRPHVKAYFGIYDSPAQVPP